MSADTQKKLAGEAAALRVEAGMVVGLGTGSTAAWFVKALAARNLPDLRCVPTSEATAELARELGLPLSTLEDSPRIDLTVDGADEVGPGLALIKGGGAALLREKLVWEASARCLVIADALDEGEAGPDLIRAVDGQVDAGRILEGGQRQAELAGQFGGGLGGGDAAQVGQVAGGQRLDEPGRGRAGAEADHHAGLDAEGGGFAGEFLLEISGHGRTLE